MQLRNENKLLLKSRKNALPPNKNGQEQAVAIPQWRWRPGMNPRSAMTIGVIFSFVGLLFILLGIVSLIAGIQDTHSTPIQYSGTVTGLTTNIFDNLPHIVIRVQKQGAAITIAPAVTQATAQSLHIGDSVIVDYSQRLNYPYALESKGQLYNLPGTNSAGNPFGSISLMLLGLLIFPYPAFLAYWGWRDLQSHAENKLIARIVALRSSKQTRIPQPGITSPFSRATYSMVLEPIDSSFSQDVVTFSLKEEMYHELHPKTLVEVTYSLNLHYVYAVQQVNENRY